MSCVLDTTVVMDRVQTFPKSDSISTFNMNNSPSTRLDRLLDLSKDNDDKIISIINLLNDQELKFNEMHEQMKKIEKQLILLYSGQVKTELEAVKPKPKAVRKSSIKVDA